MRNFIAGKSFHNSDNFGEIVILFGGIIMVNRTIQSIIIVAGESKKVKPNFENKGGVIMATVAIIGAVIVTVYGLDLVENWLTH